jgi:hypothetical protein
MSYRFIILVLTTFLLLTGCRYDQITPQQETPGSSGDYLVFGHTQGFCMNCDAVYKLQDGKLYGADHQVIPDPGDVQLKIMPASSYQLVKSLIVEIPSELLIGSSSAIQTVGSYAPDVGHVYIEVSQHHEVHRWYIEAGNTPGYLLDFLKEVNNAITQLQ